MKKSQMGFTLVEIMIVVAIIAILAVIAIPNFLQNRKDSQKSACINNMKQLVGAVEQIKMKGYTALWNADPVNDDGRTVGVGTYVKGFPDKVRCPTTGKTYESPEGDSLKAGDETEVVVLCPTGVPGHVYP